MDILNVFSGAALVGNVSQMTGTANQTSTVEGAAFYKQLMGVVDTGASQSDLAELPTNQAVMLASSAVQLQGEEMTGQELENMVEHLLDQLDELNEEKLNAEQLHSLEQLLEQITALVELISFSNDQNKSFTALVNQQAQQVSQYQLISVENQQSELLVKTSDQLLLLQQYLQQNGNKLLQGKSAEVFIADGLKNVAGKIEQLLQTVQMKPNETGLQAELSFEATQAEKKLTSDASSHLQRIEQQSVHNGMVTNQSEPASPTTTSVVSSDTTNTTVIAPDFQLRGDNVREFLMGMNRGTNGATSAFVLADEFADTMKELVVQRFNVSSLNGITEARLSLTPEHLGQVDVKISMQNGVMTAVFQTETAMAKDVLENQMIHLRASLAAQGITVERIEVAQTQLASGLDQQQKQGSSANQHGDGQSEAREKEQSFEEELLNTVTNQELGFGRAVNEVV